MVTHVSFEVDEHALLEDLASEPDTADPATLEETYFVFPVRFSMGGVNLFGREKASTSSLPLIGFARALRDGVTQLASRDASSVYLAGGGQLLLSRHDEDDVSGFCSITGIRSSDAYQQVSEASRQFSKDVSNFLQEKCPELARTAAWSCWFSEVVTRE